MKKRLPDKIHIVGSVGSGKTTLAKELSSKLNIPYYELDNVVWKRYETGDIRRTVLERLEYLHSIIHSESWIIEGVHTDDWVANSFLNADLIIFLDINYSVRTYRIIQRFLKQKLGIEKANYKPTKEIFLKMFKWNKQFENEGKRYFYENFGIYRDKMLVVRNKRDIVNYFNEFNRFTKPQ
ncbi:shikimate kinase [Ferdinandcohnia quinoae]|uniref:DNA topology modulation protein FlaR n=1 Tax=Fredinandcohnia quinoae TaxID=2918902 RepID=A0AAW5EAI2_9BACI|nr:shikimate kinase [Fredinandcohnia sp. SECRCQ15]MCH1626426.1 DNA topology modulation protein FlaR [Fredinandcohnia sp. SECRCQ15]